MTAEQAPDEKPIEKPMTVRPDGKGRITLGALARGVSSFHVHRDEQGRLILDPFAEIPARERWLFENHAARKSVKRGLRQSRAGAAKPGRSFAKFADEPSE